MSRRMRVGVIFGGRSVEHEISLISARSVMGAINPERFEVVPIGVTKDGRWLTSGDPLRLLQQDTRGEGAGRAGVRPMLPGLSGSQSVKPASPRAASSAGSEEGASGSGSLDVVFPLVHGIYGEDGTLQGLLEMADLPYVGAGVLGSALGMDKDVSRRLFAHHGLPVVATRRIGRNEWSREGPSFWQSTIVSEIGFPCFVKPAGSGSSVGVSKVASAAALMSAVEMAFEYDRKVLVERAVEAREIEVAVLGNDDPAASVPGEVVPCGEFYDYQAKYLKESQLLVPAPLEAAKAEEARRLALEAFRALELAGMARVDLFLDRANGQFYINEINTLPGFTPVSMYPRLWEASGLSYRDLVSRLISLALERYNQHKLLKTSYSPSG